jgi:hypothetical protein
MDSLNAHMPLSCLQIVKKKEIDSHHTQEAIGHKPARRVQTKGQEVDEGQESVGRGLRLAAPLPPRKRSTLYGACNSDDNAPIICPLLSCLPSPPSPPLGQN